jgi:glutathione synthase/RimK-type ligase-like ATP-grasp enzyme
MQLRIATCRPLPEPDVDENLLLEALRARGVEARMAAWNDPGERWDERVPTVIRSTWDYIHDLPRFLDWAEKAGQAAPLWNSVEIVRWNAHKGYLRELERRGHAVVPTEFLARGERARLADILKARGWRDVVVKPAVSAGSFGTKRFAAAEVALGQLHLDLLLAERDVLVQRYVDSVDDYGERSLVWIDGEFTHAIRKTPRFSGQEENVSTALPIAADEHALATAVLARHEHELLYARVDLARDERGMPMVMEVELIEPSLFLRQSPAAVTRLVDALARRLAH